MKVSSLIKISVIIPTYNYAQFIVEAIESVLQQDYPLELIEIIVVDDGSTDKTQEVLTRFIENKKIKYFYQENKGKANATCNAIKQCNGKYIFNLDADDYFLPDKISDTIKIFEEDKSIVHVASPALILDQNKMTMIGSESLPEGILGVKTGGINLLNFFYTNNIFYGSGSTYAARAEILKTIHIPDTTDMYIDEFLLLSVLPFGGSYFIDKPLSVWRMHTTNYSGKIKDDMEQKIKAQRLLNSSAAVLAYMEENNYDKSLVKIYKLKNCNRFMAYKEAEKTKSLKDILMYAKEIFVDIKPSWKLIKNYQVLNRLMPLSIYLILKKLTGKFSTLN